MHGSFAESGNRRRDGDVGLLVSLGVLKHSRHCAVTAMREARAAARRAGDHPGVAFARGLQTAAFRPDMKPPYSPGRVAVMIWAQDEQSLEKAGSALEARLTAGAVERWRVVLQPVRVRGEWMGFAPETNGIELQAHEPVVMMISGILKTRYTLRFVREVAT